MPNLSIYFAYPGELDTPTGGYRYDRRLIGELRNLGFEVNPLSLPHCAPDPAPLSLKRVQRTLAELPDQAIVIVDGLAYGVLDEAAAAEAERLKLIALCHHPLALEAGLDEEQQKRLRDSERRALEHARTVLVTSQPTQQILVSQYEVPSSKIVVAPPGTDPVPFAPCEGDPVLLLTVASLTPRKAHDLLIESLATVDDLSWRARFVGSGELDPSWAEQLQARVEDLGLAQRIGFTGPVDDTQAEYQQADVFVLPSQFEGYGMVFSEALAAGVPVIATRVGAVPDVVPEEAGLLLPVDDGPALSKALRAVLSDDALRRRLQEGAQRAATQLNRWNDTAAIVTRTLQEVAQA